MRFGSNRCPSSTSELPNPGRLYDFAVALVGVKGSGPDAALARIAAFVYEAMVKTEPGRG